MIRSNTESRASKTKERGCVVTGVAEMAFGK